MKIEQKILKAVLLLRKLGNKTLTKDEQLEEVRTWVRDGAMDETELDEWIEELKKDLSDGWNYDGEEIEEPDWQDEQDYWYEEKSYGPSNPWDAPGMSISDFVDFPVIF